MTISGGAAPPAEASLDTPPPQVARRGKLATRSLRTLKRVLKVLVKVLYLFPLLLVAKLVLYLMGHWMGDLITVAFVVLVVLFFTLFALLFVLYPLAGPPSRRIPIPRLRLPRADDLADALAQAGYLEPEMTTTHELAEHTEPDADVQEPVRVRGRVVGGEDQQVGDLVLRDCWLERDDQVARLLACGSFAVLCDGYPPVVVDTQGAIHLVVVDRFQEAGVGEFEVKHLARYDKWLQDRSSEKMSVLDVAGGQNGALAVGDEVELVAGEYSPIPDVDELRVGGRRLDLARKEGGGGPYRGETQTRALMVRSTEGAPLILCKRQ